MSVGQPTRACAAIALICVLAVGCSGGDDAATVETIPPTATTAQPTVDPTSTPGEPDDTSTTEPSTTVASSEPSPSVAMTSASSPPASSPPPVPTSSTAFVPSPTVYPAEDPRSAVEAAYLATMQMWVGCAAALPRCDTSVFPQYYTGLPLALNTESRTNQNVLGYMAERTGEYEETVQEVSIEGDTATVLACEWDPIKVFRPAIGDQPEHVLSDIVASEVKRVTMRLVGGRWLLEGGEIVERVEGGESLCE